MRKLKLLLLILLLSASTTFPQVIHNYGIKIGYVTSRQDYTFSVVNDQIEWKSGFSISAFIDLFNWNSFSISPEIKYIEKGWKGEFVVTGPDSPDPIGKKYFYTYHNYLSIPFYLQYKMKLNFGKPFIKIAPRYDILIESYDDIGSPPSVYNNFKNVFGGTLAIGFIPKLAVGINPFFEISYHIDFTNSISIPENKIKNRAFEMSVGILFQ